MIGWRRRCSLHGAASALIRLVLCLSLPCCNLQCSAWAQSRNTARNSTRSVEQWQTELQGEDLQIRRQAAIATRSLDLPLQRELLPILIERLQNEKDGQVRLAVLATVTDMGPAAEGAVGALAESMHSDFGGNYNERTHQDYRAALALAAIGQPAVEALRVLLHEEAANDRAEAAMALGRIGPAAAAAAGDLIQRLEDDEERVRDEASRSLGLLGEAALDELLDASEHPVALVRAAVIESLGQISVADDRRSHAIQKALSTNNPKCEPLLFARSTRLRCPRNAGRRSCWRILGTTKKSYDWL